MKRKKNASQSAPAISASADRFSAEESSLEYSKARYALLFIAVALVYLCTLSDRYFGLISDGQMMFDTAVSLHEFAELGIVPEVDPNSGAVVRSERYGKYGLGFPVVLQLPLLAVAPVEKALGEGRSNVLFPLTNLLIVATTALLIALCLRDLRFRFRAGARGAAFFALGSFAWPYISYDFSEPLQALCLTATFWLLIRAVKLKAPSAALLPCAGAVLGFAVLTKAALMILVPSFVFYLWASLDMPAAKRLRQLAWFSLPLAFWAAIMAVLNWYRFGSPFDFGYGSEAGQFTTPILSGLYGLLISPNKGLVFYAPFTLLVPWSLWRINKSHRSECLFLISVFALHIILTAKWWSWEGGASWGPRLLLPVLPMFAVCAGMLESTRRSIVPFVACLAAGVVINLLGVLVFFVAWGETVDLHGDRIPLDVPGRPAAEYLERDGKKWFSPDIAIYYLPGLSPIRGHAWLLGLRYLDRPFPIQRLCEGRAAAASVVNFPPLEMDFARLAGNPLTVSQICSAHLWLWETVTGRPREGDARYPLYGIGLELQGDRATIQGNLDRAVDCYKRTAELMPGFVRPTLKLSGLLVKTKKMNEAQQTLASFVDRYPADASARFALARVYEFSGNGAAALREYRALLNASTDARLRRAVEQRIAALEGR